MTVCVSSRCPVKGECARHSTNTGWKWMDGDTAIYNGAHGGKDCSGWINPKKDWRK